MRHDPQNPAVTYFRADEIDFEGVADRPAAVDSVKMQAQPQPPEIVAPVETPREQRRRLRQERQNRLENKRKVAERLEIARLDLGPSYVNSDPLLVYDRNKEPTTVLHDWFRPVFGKVRAGFLCCGGPSYRKLAVEQLNLPGVATVGVNNTSRDLNVDFAVFSDPAEKFHHGLMLDHKITKFVPLPRLGDQFRIKVGADWHDTPFRVRDCPAVFGFKRNQNFNPETFLTDDSATWGVDKKSLERGNTQEKMLNTFFLGLRVAHFLGIRRLYLVGVDFEMKRGNEYAFAGVSGNETRHLTNENSYRIAAAWCRMLKPHFDAAGFEVYNCNRESKLDAFEHVPFDVAIDDAIGHCPQPPFDFHGWYDKTTRDDGWTGRNE